MDGDCSLVDFDLGIEGAIVEEILDKRLPQVVSVVAMNEKGYTYDLKQLQQQVVDAAVSIDLCFVM